MVYRQPRYRRRVRYARHRSLPDGRCHADAWAGDLGNYVITDALSSLATRTPLAREKMEAWTRNDDEWIGAAGWNILAQLAMQDASLSDDYFQPYLDEIQRDIHNRQTASATP